MINIELLQLRHDREITERRKVNITKFKNKFNIITEELSLNYDFVEKFNLQVNTLNHFQLEYCTKGIFAERIVFPIFKPEVLIGGCNSDVKAYCGISVIDSKDILIIPDTKLDKIIFNWGYQSWVINHMIIVQDFISVFHYFPNYGNEVIGIVSDNVSKIQLDLLLGAIPEGNYTLYKYKERSISLNGLECDTNLKIINL